MPTDTAPTDEALEVAASRLGNALRSHGWRMATAESCTGGLIGHAITAVPGSSDYYVGGVICYWNRAKELELGVPPELIAEHGAVSPEVAASLADGARRRFNVDVAVAVTGIAGPEGGTSGKPVGLAYLAVAHRGHPPVVERELWPFDRDGNKRASALRALELLTIEATSSH
jgi:PncC family amidohydrolase